MKKTLFCILCLFLCISMLGIIPAAMAENAPVRVGELIWIQEDENQRSASIARIRKVRDAILSIRSDKMSRWKGPFFPSLSTLTGTPIWSGKNNTPGRPDSISGCLSRKQSREHGGDSI